MDDHQAEAESRMRQSLGVPNEARLSAGDDAQRLARQAIRSQATAREYAERHLARAEQTIQDLQAKFQTVRREKAVAIEAARTAHEAQTQAERGRRAAEAALINEKSISDTAQREAWEARAIIQDLRIKLVHANQTVDALQTELTQARQAGVAAGQAQPTALVPEVADESASAVSDPPVKRKRGRPPGKRDPATLPKSTRKTYAADQAPVQWWSDGWTPSA